LTPGEVYPFSIEIAPTGVLLKAGMRLGVRIKATDRGETPPNFLEKPRLRPRLARRAGDGHRPA